MTWLDDHSRYALDVTAHQPVGPARSWVTAFWTAVARSAFPASTLTTTG